MLTTFDIVRLPEARDEARVRHQLQKFATSPLFAFVIRQAGETNEEALALVERLAPESIRFTGRRIPMDVVPQENKRLVDFGVHLDFEQDDNPAVTGINLHHTTQGKVRASFFLPGPRALEDLRKLGECLIPHGVTGAFRRGQADTDYIMPTCHQAILEAGDAVLFKEGLPLVHDFTTLETPRRARAHLGTLAVPCMLESTAA